MTLTGRHPEVADGRPVTFRTRVAFADYGIAVNVGRPAG
jgi:hypothetical protein